MALSPSRLLSAAALAAVALALSPAHAQEAPSLRIAAHPSAAYVTSAGPGAAVRVTTVAERPSVGERLDRWRGVRVFREAPAYPVAVPATPAARVVRSPEGRFVRHGGATYPAVRR